MALPLYFTPDPEIEDSDLLGYGDITYDDGTTQFLNGDPESAIGLPRSGGSTPSADIWQPDFNEGAPPQLDLPEGVSIEPDGSISTPQGVVRNGQFNPVQDQPSDFGMQNGAAVDYLQGLNYQQQANANAPKGTHEAPMGADELQQQSLMGMLDTPTAREQQQWQPDLAAAQGQPPPPAQLPPGVQIEPDGSISTPQGVVQNGRLVPYQREVSGALPPELAAQQRADMLGMQQQSILATQQARAQEAQIIREAALKRQGEIEAQRQEEQRRIQEQEAKQNRLMQERQAVERSGIQADIYDAKGELGGTFAVLGAALMALGGNAELGVRMLDNAINTKVKENMLRRDSALNRLSDELGNTKQAIAAGRAKIYDLLAQKAEQTVVLTKADVYEAHSPEVIQALKQKSLEEMQKFDQLSIGKTIDTFRAPTPAKGPTPAQLQGYGKATQAQQQSQQDALRALRAIGGVYDPQTGKIINRDEILANKGFLGLEGGIPGVGGVDTFMAELGKLPVVGSLPKALDTAATSGQGLEVRTALQALVEAKAQQRNPGRAPTDADREAARNELGLNTEEGVIDAIERVLNDSRRAPAANVATYGEGAAAAYQQTLGQQGGQLQSVGATPAPIEMLQPGTARQQLRQMQQAPQVQPGEAPLSALSPEQRMGEVAAAIQGLAGSELPPEGVDILRAQAALESGNGASQGAAQGVLFGHKATGKQAGADFATTEGEGAAAQRTRARFRTFGTADEAVSAHIDLLKRKYPDAWQALEQGDVAAYVAALKDGGYFTASETDYLRGLQRSL